MFADLLLAIASIFDIMLTVYMWIIIASAVISWVNPDPYSPIVRFLYSVTEPVLMPIRRLIGFRVGPIDISPLIVVLAIILTQEFLINSLIEFAHKLKRGDIV